MGKSGGFCVRRNVRKCNEEIEQSSKWKRIRADAEKNGVSVILFAGNLKVCNKTTGAYEKVEGIRQTDINGNTVYYIKADKLARDAAQIYMHEKFHDLVSRNPALWADLTQVLYERDSAQEIAAKSDRRGVAGRRKQARYAGYARRAGGKILD